MTEEKILRHSHDTRTFLPVPIFFSNALFSPQSLCLSVMFLLKIVRNIIVTKIELQRFYIENQIDLGVNNALE
jgi:hypothetical protein